MLFVCVSIFSQKKEIVTNVFTLDLSNPSSKSLTSSDETKTRLQLQSKDLLQFKIIGGNPFRYKYVINNRFVDFFEDKSKNPLDINSITKKNVENSISESKKEDKKKEIEKLTELKKIVTIEIKKEKNLFNKSNENILNLKKFKLDSINTKLKILENSEYVPIGNFAKTYLKLINVKDLKEDLNNMSTVITVLGVKADSLRNEIESYKMQTVSNEILNFEEFKILRENFQLIAKKIVSEYLRLKQDAIKFETLGNNYESEEKNLKNILEIINNDLKFFYSVKLENYTPPIDINGKNIDAVEITLKRLDSNNNNLPIDDYCYTIWINGGLKIDVSGGIFISSLINNEYYVEDDGTNNIKHQLIKERKKGNFDFGFGTTINISHRGAGWINPTINIGAMFTTNQQFQLLSGLGLILGKQERMIFSSGLSMGRVSRLAENYNADGTTAYNLGTGTVPTSNVFAFGYYFGITYNFSSNKKQTPK